MANIVKTEKQELSMALRLQDKLLQELDAASQQMGADFTDYGKKCVISAIGGLVTLCASQGIDLKDLNPTLLKLSLQNIGYTELNYSAMPAEIYYDLRKTVDKDGKISYVATIKPQGAGNEKLTRKYGVGLKKDIGLKSAWLVREGDEFTYPSFNGLEMTPPKWTPKSYDKKVIMVVYPAVKIDGSVEYLIATRESVKANIIAQIRQNAMYSFNKFENGKKVTDYEKRDALYEELNQYAENHTVDEILSDPKWLKWVNPTYTSGGSKEQMILRKMKNNALKNYPKEYDNAYIRDAVENMFEDNDETVIEKPKKVVEDVVEVVEKEINETTNENAVQDFEVDEEGAVEKPVAKDEVEKAEEKKSETTDNSNDDDYGF